MQTYSLDLVGPIITITDDILTGPVQSDDFTVVINDALPDISSYMYGFSSDTTCDVSDTYPNVIMSGTGVTFNTEVNNGSYLCVTATDLAGNTTYSLASTNPLNIDITLPVVALTDPYNSFPVLATSTGGISQLTLVGT